MTASSPASADSTQPAENSATPAHRPSAMARARAIWVNRRILRILIIRDLKVRYSDSVLGFAWTLLDPLMLTLVYWFVFGVIVAGRGGANEQPYILWLLTGILPFQWTAHVLGDSGRLLGNDAKLVTSSSLPREIWVLRSVSSRFIEFLFTLPITVVFVLFFMLFTDQDVSVTWWVFILPVAFAVQFLFNVGLALTLSPLCMLYPDVHRIVRVFTTLYRYLSPVIYGLGTLTAVFSAKGWPSWLEWVYASNPLVGILNLYHAVLFPDNTDNVLLLLSFSTALSVLCFVIGWRLFRRLESRVLKEL